MVKFQTIVGRNLKYIRYQSGLSQEDYYTKHGLSFKYYSMVERGELNLRASTIDKLVDHLNIPLKELLIDDPSREIKTTRIDARN